MGTRSKAAAAMIAILALTLWGCAGPTEEPKPSDSPPVAPPGVANPLSRDSSAGDVERALFHVSNAHSAIQLENFDVALQELELVGKEIEAGIERTKDRGERSYVFTILREIQPHHQVALTSTREKRKDAFARIDDLRTRLMALKANVPQT